MTELSQFPSGERIAKGLADLGHSRVTVEGLLVAIAAGRLRELGLAVPEREDLPVDPELALYARLGSTEADPYFSYRALIDGLDSFISCFESIRPFRDTQSER